MTYLPEKKSQRRVREARLAAFPLAAAAFVLAIVTGCQTSLDTARSEELFAKTPLKPKDAASIDDVDGPLARSLRQASSDDRETPQQLRNEGLQRDLDVAKQQRESGRHDLAEKTLKSVAKQSKSGESFFDRMRLFWRQNERDKRPVGHSAIREEALFLLAESRFEQKKYPAAKDSYDALLKEYPSTRYLEPTTRRLFTIARLWLDLPDFVTSEEIRQVDLERPGKDETKEEKSKPERSSALVPNVSDRTRPTFDTKGHALQALKSIWMNDPTGPLADDALMMTASHYLRKEDYREADHYFGILREEYPKSRHLEAAFVLGSHVKLMSYQGAGYDGKQLEDAKQLKQSTLRLFPNIPQKELLIRELKDIEDAEAQRDWDKAQFYQRKKNWEAVAIYCNLVLEKHPSSTYAQNARELLQEIEAEHADAAQPRWFDKLRLPSSRDASSQKHRTYEEEPPPRLPPNGNEAPGRARM